MKNVYENSFIHGRELTKKLVVVTVIGCVLSLISMGLGNSLMQLFLVATTTVSMILAVYVMIKFCVCPHCGKHITLGVLVVESCPRCKRNLVSGKKMKKSKR